MDTTVFIAEKASVGLINMLQRLLLHPLRQRLPLVLQPLQLLRPLQRLPPKLQLKLKLLPQQPMSQRQNRKKYN